MIWPGPCNFGWQPVLEAAEHLAALATISIATAMVSGITLPDIEAGVTGSVFSHAVAAAITAPIMGVETDSSGAKDTVAADQWSAEARQSKTSQKNPPFK